MRGVRYEQVPQNYLLPLREWNYNEEYMLKLPAQVERLLEARYGDNWNIPDPMFRLFET
jgi:hypothetical protein